MFGDEIVVRLGEVTEKQRTEMAAKIQVEDEQREFAVPIGHGDKISTTTAFKASV